MNDLSACTVVDLTKALIAKSSVTPNDAGCQPLLISRLERLGFYCESIVSGQVTNLWARRGTNRPLIVFAGHTDVVPTGPLASWTSAPFVPTEREGFLYGRGAADMKSSIAAFVVAVEEFINDHPNYLGSIALLITSDEEGPGIEGTAVVCKLLEQRQEKMDYCIVGEPTCVKALGDTCKIGRRGSLSGHLTIHGIQGHVAYPQLARNPIHDSVSALAELVRTQWDTGNEFFPSTGFQISNIHSGTGATNVIPEAATVDFNFRFSTASTSIHLKTYVHQILDQHGLDYDLTWNLSAEPFLTEQGPLSRAISQAIESETGLKPEFSTTGGTSDGRFIAKICSQVIEFGPTNATIHQINECVALSSLQPLKNIYKRTLKHLLIPS